MSSSHLPAPACLSSATGSPMSILWHWECASAAEEMGPCRCRKWLCQEARWGWWHSHPPGGWCTPVREPTATLISPPAPHNVVAVSEAAKLPGPTGASRAVCCRRLLWLQVKVGALGVQTCSEGQGQDTHRNPKAEFYLSDINCHKLLTRKGSLFLFVTL